MVSGFQKILMQQHMEVGIHLHSMFVFSLGCVYPNLDSYDIVMFIGRVLYYMVIAVS